MVVSILARIIPEFNGGFTSLGVLQAARTIKASNANVLVFIADLFGR
jgi:hypothetical protein